MNKIKIIINILLMCILTSVIFSCHNYKPINDNIILQKDSLENNIIYQTIIDTFYIDTCDSLKYIKIIDSLNNIYADINEELFITKYKLERISYYNSIAANGNNIKFLRGWINRVLNDE